MSQQSRFVKGKIPKNFVISWFNVFYFSYTCKLSVNKFLPSQRAWYFKYISCKYNIKTIWTDKNLLKKSKSKLSKLQRSKWIYIHWIPYCLFLVKKWGKPELWLQQPVHTKKSSYGLKNFTNHVSCSQTKLLLIILKEFCVQRL